jgi:hypothetical protein
VWSANSVGVFRIRAVLVDHQGQSSLPFSAASQPTVLYVTNGPSKANYGMVTHHLRSDITADLAELNAGIIRVDFDWFRIEPQDNNFQWADIDNSVANAKTMGLQIFATLAYTPEWAGGTVNHNRVPNLDLWRRFVTTAVSRYPEIQYWGIWNEPDIGGTNGNFNEPKSRYYELAVSSRTAIKGANANASVVGPDVFYDGLDYLEDVMSHVGSIFDIVSVHWYRQAELPILTHMAVARARANGQPLWLTEVGLDICDVPDGETQQASLFQNMLEQFQYGYEIGWTKVFGFHLYAEAETTCGKGKLAIVDTDHRRRPAFNVYKNWIATHP